jgi:flagellar motility protein MotE (MotC chaperone)
VKGRVSLVGIGIALVFLLIAKVFISGVFLKSGSVSSSTVDLAMAENREQQHASLGTGEPSGALSPETLKERELALRAKELSLKKKEEELLPLKKDIEEKLAELNELQSRLTAYAKTLAEREETLKDTKMTHLVEVYTAMEPAKAAAIMEKLKMQTVVLILRHMKGKAAGQIVSLIKPELAAVVVEKLSQAE